MYTLYCKIKISNKKNNVKKNANLSNNYQLTILIRESFTTCFTYVPDFAFFFKFTQYGEIKISNNNKTMIIKMQILNNN